MLSNMSYSQVTYRLKGQLGKQTFSMQMSYDFPFDQKRRSFTFDCSQGSAVVQQQCSSFFSADYLAQNAIYFFDIMFYMDGNFVNLVKADLNVEYSCWDSGVAVVDKTQACLSMNPSTSCLNYQGANTQTIITVYDTTADVLL